jgi:6 kDa early secretory antigenic target
MSMDGLRVDHGALERAALDLQATVSRIDDRMDRLEGELAPLRSDWSGEAQQAYATAKAGWDSALAEMRDLLDQTRRAVDHSNDEYRAADLRGARSFGG